MITKISRTLGEFLFGHKTVTHTKQTKRTFYYSSVTRAALVAQLEAEGYVIEDHRQSDFGIVHDLVSATSEDMERSSIKVPDINVVIVTTDNGKLLINGIEFWYPMGMEGFCPVSSENCDMDRFLLHPHHPLDISVVKNGADPDFMTVSDGKMAIRMATHDSTGSVPVVSKHLMLNSFVWDGESFMEHTTQFGHDRIRFAIEGGELFVSLSILDSDVMVFASQTVPHDFYDNDVIADAANRFVVGLLLTIFNSPLVHTIDVNQFDHELLYKTLLGLFLASKPA